MNEERIKLSIVLPNLQAGGAERVLSFVAQELDKDKFDTTLVIIGHEKNAAYAIKGIKVEYFEKSRVLTGIPKLFNYIRRQKPNIVLSAVGHLNTITAYMSKLFPKTKFVAREVNVLSVLDTFVKKPTNHFDFLYRNRFNHFDKIICQSQDMLNDLNEHNNIKQEKLVVINNPITDGFKVKEPTGSRDVINFITVARLKKQKGHLRVIEALGKLDFPFHYTMIGSGPEKDMLLERAAALGFSDKVTNIPYTDDVPKYLAESDIYLQGSYVEGFPNALIESCAVGVPAIAFNAPGGINEIIIDGVNGYMVEDEDQFIEKINLLKNNGIMDPKSVSESVYSRYHKDVIIETYENVLMSLTN